MCSVYLNLYYLYITPLLIKYSTVKVLNFGDYLFTFTTKVILTTLNMPINLLIFRNLSA